MSAALNIIYFLLFETFILDFATTETVHFINSESHSNPSSNFTTYKLTVPGSDPITIIEDTKHQSTDLSNNNDRYADHSILTRRNGDHFAEKELISTSPSQLQLQRLNNRNQDVRATLSFQISDSEKLNDDTNNGGDKKKVTYSPSLLKKFIKEYSEKIKNADQTTKNALKEIERINQKHTTDESEVTTDRMDFDMDEDNAEEKYSTWNDRYAHKHQSQVNPYNDKDGWVTLEAVPWSSSKVSKWHPNNNNNNKFTSFDNNHSYDRPHSHQPSYADDEDNHHTYPKPRPQSTHYNEELDDDYIDDRPSLKPIYTSYETYKPYTNSRPQYASNSPWSQNQNSGYEKRPSYKPRPRPQYDYSHSVSNNQQHSTYSDDRHDQNDWYNADQNTPKPWSQDIITDNRPPDFPIRSPSKRPHSSIVDRDPTRYRPFSHPDNGNGEWVLVSTTKGYQAPSRHGQRAMSLSNNQLNDLTSHHSVKLTVLPSKNNTFSYDRKPMALSHGGMLEVESSFETVEDSAATALGVKGTKKPIVKKRKVFRSVPMKQGTRDDGSAVMAAVGAGMVPATMAMLMPMVLGRRKRNVDNSFGRKPKTFSDFK